MTPTPEFLPILTIDEKWRADPLRFAVARYLAPAEFESLHTAVSPRHDHPAETVREAGSGSSPPTWPREPEPDFGGSRAARRGRVS